MLAQFNCRQTAHPRRPPRQGDVLLLMCISTRTMSSLPQFAAAAGDGSRLNHILHVNGGRATALAHHGHGGRPGTECAHGQDEHTVVVVSEEQQPRRRHRQLELAYLAVLHDAHRHRVEGVEVAGSPQRQARALVVSDLVIGHVPLAAGVGALDRSRGHHGVQRGAGSKNPPLSTHCPQGSLAMQPP